MSELIVIEVTFGIRADNLDPDELTRLLVLYKTHSFRRGDPLTGPQTPAGMAGRPRIPAIGGEKLPAAVSGGTIREGWGNIGSHKPISSAVALNSALKWLGSGYREIAPGVYRSNDGRRQFRMTNSDLIPTHGNLGSHVHFEALDAAGTVIENLHLPITP